MSAASGLSRREFLKGVGGVVVVITTTPGSSSAMGLDAEAAEPTFNAYLGIGQNGRVTCFTGKVEMGQGIITSLPQMLADELDVAVEMIDMVMGDTDRCPFDHGTWGSLTTRIFGPELQAAAAEARQVLLELAGERFGVLPGQLDTDNGLVFVRADPAQTVSYAALAKGRAIVRESRSPAEVETRSGHGVVGKSFTRRDARDKVTGCAQFTADIRLPGMRYARILRPPAHGANLRSLDKSAAEAIEGVHVVQDGDLVAVLHEKRDIADHAITLLETEYAVPDTHVNERTIYEHLLNTAPEGSEVASEGDIAAGERSASEVVEETYRTAYVAHAPMEPHAALAGIQDDKMTVWASTQVPFPLKRMVMSALDLEDDQVRVITPFLGGGFGGKEHSVQGVHAARLASIVGQPVQLFWTREDEFFWDTYRPAAIVRIRSGLTPAGSPAFWDYRVFYAGDRGSAHHYDIAHHRTVAHMRSLHHPPPESHPMATGAWRGLGASSNAFAREQHIDIMAEKASVDPLTYRLRHIANPKFHGALKAVAEKVGWKPTAGSSGRGIGIACGIDAETVVATLAEVDVARESGEVSVKRVVCAQDMGLVVNPAGATIQMEGAITMGLGYALMEEQLFRGGDIVALNFERYPIPTFSTLPTIETILIDSDDPAPHGGGEPAVTTVGAAIANAVYDAIGARVFELPMTPKRVISALNR